MSPSLSTFFRKKKSPDNTTLPQEIDDYFSGFVEENIGVLAGQLTDEQMAALFSHKYSDLINREIKGSASLKRLETEYVKYVANHNAVSAVYPCLLPDRKCPPLSHWAAAERRTDELACLPKEAFEEKASDGSSSLYHALRVKHITNACFLLKNYPEMAQAEWQGLLAVHYAIQFGCTAEDLKQLSEAGMDCTLRDASGYSMVCNEYLDEYLKGRRSKTVSCRIIQLLPKISNEPKLKEFLLSVNDNAKPHIEPHWLPTAEELGDGSEWETQSDSDSFIERMETISPTSSC